MFLIFAQFGTIRHTDEELQRHTGTNLHLDDIRAQKRTRSWYKDT
jgi:hypothetical protein